MTIDGEHYEEQDSELDDLNGFGYDERFDLDGYGVAINLGDKDFGSIDEWIESGGFDRD